MKIQSRSMSDPTLSDNDFKNEMDWVWTILKGVSPDFRPNFENLGLLNK